MLSGCDGSSSENSGFRKAQFGYPEIVPNIFQFRKIQVNEEDESRVRMQNVGTYDLTLKDISWNMSQEFEIYWFQNEAEMEQRVGIKDGLNNFGRIVIPPNESITFVAVYRRTGEQDGESGALTMRTNAQEVADRDLSIPVKVEESQKQLVVAPLTVQFGRVAVGEKETRTVNVANPGTEAVIINQIVLTGQTQNFKARIDGQDIMANPGAVPGMLGPDKSFQIEVEFIAAAERQDEAELKIVSDANPPITTVNLVANGKSPCIKVSPTEVTYMTGLVGRPNEKLLTIESCGGEPLRLDNIEVVEGAGVFSISPDTQPELPALLPAADLQQIPPLRPSYGIKIVFTPEEEMPYSGMLMITHNDETQRLAGDEGAPKIEVPLSGRGSANSCPEGRLNETDITVKPLDVIQLDGSASIDMDGPDGRPVEYEWVVIERPEGSTAQPVEEIGNPLEPAEGGPPDNKSTPTARFFVDLVGEYIIELRVTDSFGISNPSAACPEPVARLRVLSEPTEDIHLQLVWNTPRDPDQTDLQGADVDLHFLHPSGSRWFGGLLGKYDCYFENTSPDWGIEFDQSDDPSLDIDDTNGAGPENINLNNPENTDSIGGPYRVGVHYYRATLSAFEAMEVISEVTIRIYLGSVLAYEKTETLDSTSDFWEVAGIIWTPGDRRVVEVNQVSFQLPDGF
jgi:hypothetical protein